MRLVISRIVGFARLLRAARTLARSTFGPLMALGALCAAAGAAHAQADFERLDRIPLAVERWGGWENLGGVLFSRPDCFAVQVNRIDCFGMVQGGLARTAWDGQRWTGPGVLGGVVMELGSQPDCAAWAVDHIDCFVRRSGDKAPFRRTMHGSFITGWEALGGALSTDADCVSVRAERLDCFGRGTDGALYRNSFNGDIWSAWSLTPGRVYDGAKPSCVAFRGDVHCMFATTIPDPNTSTGVATRLKHFHFPAGGGLVQRDMQGGSVVEVGPTFDAGPKCSVSFGPDAGSPHDDKIHCFAPSATSGLGWWIFDGQGAGNWALSNLGGALGGDWDCVVRSEDRIDCMELVRQSQMANAPLVLRHRVFQTGQGVRTADAGLAPIMAPRTIRCMSWAADRIDCLTGGANLDGAPLQHSWLTLEQPIVYTRQPGR